MAFSNRIRLPFYISKPQYPDSRNVFKRADGTTKVLSININKTYIGETDYLPDWVHQCLKIALSHDHVNIEGHSLMLGVTSEGDYDIDWSEFLDYPYAQAKFKVAVTPFNFSNANCQTCEGVNQLNLADDTMPDVLEQSTEYTLNLLTNDIINCSPFTIELTYINAVFVASATIDANGLLTINTKPLFFQRNSVILVTYRVTCSNGSYDEANVVANLNGAEVATCLEPTGVVVSGDPGENSATINFVEPSPAPVQYEWQLALAESPTVIVDSATIDSPVSSVDLPSATGDALDSNTDYIFSIRGSCGGEDFSEWVNLPFTTASAATACGRYRITHYDELKFKNVTYINCSGTISTIRLRAFSTRGICALENSPGNPVSIIGVDNITYQRPC